MLLFFFFFFKPNFENVLYITIFLQNFCFHLIKSWLYSQFVLLMWTSVKMAVVDLQFSQI